MDYNKLDRGVGTMIHVDIFFHDIPITQYNVYMSKVVVCEISCFRLWYLFLHPSYERFEVPDAALATKGLARIPSRSRS